MKMPRLQSYTDDFKLDAIRFLDEHQGNVTLTAKEFGVDRKRIREWREPRNMLQQSMTGEKKKKRKLHQGREVRSIEIDQAVLLFLDDE